ncbi:hypothetical protein M8542_15605 [Amycolatopsis sp. OK19-0408]|uniref:Uncharacterized protein n=1 Tax=Amycolatopsis iheyensis TaxID=2945988 RepID=A0A9X2NBJ1_9PSEU|nr:hypothetical protein [Amycolatopsis iheyensis]MCR6484248.1 hypothetical protein [Amycolatopsis iheyensis]
MYPPKDHTVLIALSVLAVVIVLGGAAAWFLEPGSAEPRAAPLELPAQWPTPGGEPLRPVPMPTGEMAAALPSGTSGQVLCAAVPEQTWASVLGGPVRQEVDKNGQCHVVTATVDASATLWADPVPMRGTAPEPVTVSGRQATVGPFGLNGYGEILTARLSDATEKWTRSSLQLIVNRVPGARDEHDFRSMALSLAGPMIGAITTPGPALPRTGESREMTPVPGSGIVDAPYPFISWQLCTQLAKALGAPLDQLKPGPFGSCARENDGTAVSLTYHSEGEDYFPDRVAGRPAHDNASGSNVVVQLLDDSRQTLEISWIDATQPRDALRDLAEKVVPPLLGR